MPPEWLSVLSPVASKIVEKMLSGQKVASSEQQIVLLFELANTSKEIKELRTDISDMCSAIREMSQGLSEIRVDTTYIRAKIDGR